MEDIGETVRRCIRWYVSFSSIDIINSTISEVGAVRWDTHSTRSFYPRPCRRQLDMYGGIWPLSTFTPAFKNPCTTDYLDAVWIAAPILYWFGCSTPFTTTVDVAMKHCACVMIMLVYRSVPKYRCRYS